MCLIRVKENVYIIFTIVLDPSSGGLSSTSRLRRIIDGQEATFGEFPWMVHIKVFTNRTTNHICSGSLITDQFIVSAAHCFETR